MAEMTDTRNLRVKIFQLVNQDNENYSSFMEFDENIDPNEPSGFSEQQIKILTAKGFLPFNNELLTERRDPTRNSDVKESISKANGKTAGDVQIRVDPVYSKSRLINIIDEKQLLLRNRFDEINVIKDTRVIDYTNTAKLTSKLEIKYLYNYRQVFNSDLENQYSYRTSIYNTVYKIYQIFSKLSVNVPIGIELDNRYTFEFTMSTTGNLIVNIVYLNSYDENDLKEIEVEITNAVSAYIQEELEYNISQVKAYDDKFEKEYDERTMSFSLPYTNDPILNRISNKQTSKDDFGFVIYEAGTDIYETNSLGQRILSSDDTKFVDYGYLLSVKTLKNAQLNMSGRRAVLPSSPTVFNKRYINIITDKFFDINNYGFGGILLPWSLSGSQEKNYYQITLSRGAGAPTSNPPDTYYLINDDDLVVGIEYYVESTITIIDQADALNSILLKFYGDDYIYNSGDTISIKKKFTYTADMQLNGFRMITTADLGTFPIVLLQISNNTKITRIED